MTYEFIVWLTTGTWKGPLQGMSPELGPYWLHGKSLYDWNSRSVVTHLALISPKHKTNLGWSHRKKQPWGPAFVRLT